jgi:hypothetical protein
MPGLPPEHDRDPNITPTVLCDAISVAAEFMVDRDPNITPTAKKKNCPKHEHRTQPPQQ